MILVPSTESARLMLEISPLQAKKLELATLSIFAVKAGSEDIIFTKSSKAASSF